MEMFADLNTWVSILTLTLLEIVLGIDNIVFISILAQRLPREKQERARVVGLTVALAGRLALLFSLSAMMALTSDLFTVFEIGISGRDLILLVGGLFLLWKASTEVFHYVEGEDPEHKATAKQVSFGAIILQILLIDIVFSLDSVITAVGMTDKLPVMIIAVVLSIGVMLIFAGRIARFIEKHPSIKLLALGFLLMIGVLLVAESFDQHISKGYVYFAMAFSLGVEVLNIQRRKRHGPPAPVELHPPALAPTPIDEPR